MPNNPAREIILQATLEAIAECSISNASMRVIAEKAGMRQPNLHYYFKTKKELLIQLMDWTQKHYDKLMDEFVTSQDTLQNKLSGYFAQEQYCMEHEPAYTRVTFDMWGLGQMDPEINEHYARTYTIWRERIAASIGQHMPELSEETRNLTAAMIISMIMGASLQYMSNPQAFNLDRYMQHCLDTVMLSLQHSAEFSVEPEP